MYVYFTTGEDVSNVTLELGRDADEAATYFDEIRVFENQSVMYNENTTQQMVNSNKTLKKCLKGIFPFVVGDVEGYKITVLTYLKNMNHTLNVDGTVRKLTTLSKATGH